MRRTWRRETLFGLRRSGEKPSLPPFFLVVEIFDISIWGGGAYVSAAVNHSKLCACELPARASLAIMVSSLRKTPFPGSPPGPSNKSRLTRCRNQMLLAPMAVLLLLLLLFI
jgi:hypothetical protein